MEIGIVASSRTVKPGMFLIAMALLLLLRAESHMGRGGLGLDFIIVCDLQGWPNHLGDDEPAIDITLVPCRAFGLGLPDEYLYRLTRVHFPRSKKLLQEFKVQFFNHPRLSFFTTLQQEMMVDFAGTENKISIAYPLSHYLLR